MSRFDLDRFTADCLTAVKADPTHRAVHEVMKAAFADVGAVAAGVGVQEKGGIFPIYRSPELTIINAVWPSEMTLMPHNHRMWAVIGVYGGREDNIFWRRIKDDPRGRIEAAGAEALSTGDVKPLGRDIIHSVTNPIPRLTGAIHVYGGEFFEQDRSQWDPERLTEEPYDIEKAKARFAS